MWGVVLLVAVDGKIAAVSMDVVQGFGDSLREGVEGDTADCVWGKSVDTEYVRLYHVWRIVALAAVDGKIVAVRMDEMEDSLREGVEGDTTDWVWGKRVDMEYVRLYHVWSIVPLAPVDEKVVMEGCEGNMIEGGMEDIEDSLWGTIEVY